MRGVIAALTALDAVALFSWVVFGVRKLVPGQEYGGRHRAA